MGRNTLIVPMATLSISVLLASCASNSQSVTPTVSQRHASYVTNCDLDPASCMGGGSGNPTGPDPSKEGRCNASGGSFIDIDGDGGSGVDCAGQPNGPKSTNGSKCGLQYFIYGKGHSLLIFQDGSSLSDLSGIRIDGTDCSWETFR